MPSGVPVGTLAINGSKNAALLAIQIIGVENEEVAAKLADYKNGMTDKVAGMNARVRKHFGH
jgi:5-(carboxyamino)imidazole ribonucleotide mutase